MKNRSELHSKSSEISKQHVDTWTAGDDSGLIWFHNSRFVRIPSICFNPRDKNVICMFGAGYCVGNSIIRLRTSAAMNSFELPSSSVGTNRAALNVTHSLHVISLLLIDFSCTCHTCKLSYRIVCLCCVKPKFSKQK